MIANWVLAAAGLPIEPGPLSFIDAPLVAKPDSVAGLAPHVPWARHSPFLALAQSGATTMVVRLPAATPSVLACNLAEEPRDSISVEAQLDAISHRDTPMTFETLTLIGAAMRALQLAGAIESILAMTLGYVQEREQFGRPLGSFQVVQHLVAQIAGEAAAARVAGDLAVDALENGIDPDAIAAAKIRAGEAAGSVAAAAHQLHGAMGFTREHRLHHFTRRVLAWRDEFGGEALWSEALGRRLAPAGGRVWHRLTEV
jgi:acyl-CoA dehydrogenase